MKAWVLHGIGDLRLEEREEKALLDEEVLVAVKAAGICGSDIPRCYQTGAHTHPLILGHEFAGKVVKLGAKADKSWLGQRVGVFPLLPCKECIPCQKKQYEMCQHYSYLGSRQDGGFAEYVTVPVWNLLPLPEEVTYEEAAMLEPMAVAAHAMRRLCVSSSDTVAVCGLGTIGLLLVMFLWEAGIRNLFVLGNKEFQKEKILELGLPETSYCDIRSEKVSQWLKEHTTHLGVDCFFECVGKNQTISLAIEHTAPSGKVMLIGNPFEDLHLKKEIYWKILRCQLQIFGTWNSSFLHTKEDDWNYVLRLLQQKKISPTKLISHRFSLEELETGLEIMRDKTEEYGKIIIS